MPDPKIEQRHRDLANRFWLSTTEKSELAKAFAQFEADLLATPAQKQESGEGVLTGKVYQRRDEWVLELSGVLNDCSFITRHTEPLSTPIEDVPGLPSLYSAQPVEPAAGEVTDNFLPAEIGRLLLSDRRASGERLCAHGHIVPTGHPLYWPASIGQYDDSDPYCLTHAIEDSETQQGWTEAADGTMQSLWKPICELTNLYQQPIMIASPKLVCGDSNPLGIAEAYWQDTTGPEKGEWRTTSFDMCNDEWNTITLAKEDVTHFLIPQAPWSAVEEGLTHSPAPSATIERLEGENHG